MAASARACCGDSGDRSARHARYRHSRRDHSRRHRRARLHRRRRDRRRDDRRGRRQGRAGEAGHRRQRSPGHAGLGRCPHSLRRPGDLGPGTGPLLLARRDDDSIRQLRRRICAGAQGAPQRADRSDGSGRRHPRHGARRGAELGVGKLPGLSRRSGAAAAHDRCRGTDPAPSATRLHHGRARHQPRGRDPRRHRRYEPSDRGGDPRRRVRFHDLAHLFAQDDRRRAGPGPQGRGGRADRHRPRLGRRRPRRLRDEQRFRG